MRMFLFLLMFLLSVVFANAQPNEIKTGNASISGRITTGEKPLVGVNVTLRLGNQFGGAQQKNLSTKTDADGRYRFAGIGAGNYAITPYALAFVFAEENRMMPTPGKSVIVSEGENIEDINFTLTRGGVITGKITDHEGRPVIEQHVQLSMKDANGQNVPVTPNQLNFMMSNTDDRGVYRLYGLRPGKYIVSMGESRRNNSIVVGGANKRFSQTFYPGVAAESEAQLVDVTAGSEATGIDFRLGQPNKTYDARGRIVDAATGQPVAGLRFGYGAMRAGERRMGAFGSTMERSNAKGEFRIQGLTPGTYGAFIYADEGSAYYSEPAIFEIVESDFNGLEIKAQSGATINGAVIMEGAANAAARLPLNNLLIMFQTDGAVSGPYDPSPRVNADGSFRLTGIRPGKGRFYFPSLIGGPRLTLLRIEREGTPIRDTLEVAAGEQISGIRLIVAVGAGVIRGQVNLVGGALPAGVVLFVSARKLNASNQAGNSVQVDARGRFVVENLAPGEYEIALNPPFVPGQQISPGYMKKRVTQNVTVNATGETSVTLTMDLSEQGGKQ